LLIIYIVQYIVYVNRLNLIVTQPANRSDRKTLLTFYDTKKIF